MTRVRPKNPPAIMAKVTRDTTQWLRDLDGPDPMKRRTAYMALYGHAPTRELHEYESKRVDIPTHLTSSEQDHVDRAIAAAHKVRNHKQMTPPNWWQRLLFWLRSFFIEAEREL